MQLLLCVGLRSPLKISSHAGRYFEMIWEHCKGVALDAYGRLAVLPERDSGSKRIWVEATATLVQVFHCQCRQRSDLILFHPILALMCRGCQGDPLAGNNVVSKLDGLRNVTVGHIRGESRDRRHFGEVTDGF